MQEEDIILANADLSEKKECLEERVFNRERQVEELREKFKNALQAEVMRNEELQQEMEEESASRRDLLKEIDERNNQIDSLNQQIVQLKSKCVESNQLIGTLKDTTNHDMENERRKLVKRVKKLLVLMT